MTQPFIHGQMKVGPNSRSGESASCGPVAIHPLRRGRSTVKNAMDLEER